MWQTPTYSSGCHSKITPLGSIPWPLALVSALPPSPREGWFMHHPSLDFESVLGRPGPWMVKLCLLRLSQLLKLWSPQGLGPCSFLFDSPGPTTVARVCVALSQSILPWVALPQRRDPWRELKPSHKSAILPLKFASTSPSTTPKSDAPATRTQLHNNSQAQKALGGQKRNTSAKYENSESSFSLS